MYLSLAKYRQNRPKGYEGLESSQTNSQDQIKHKEQPSMVKTCPTKKHIIYVCKHFVLFFSLFLVFSFIFPFFFFFFFFFSFFFSFFFLFLIKQR